MVRGSNSFKKLQRIDAGESHRANRKVRVLRMSREAIENTGSSGGRDNQGGTDQERCSCAPPHVLFTSVDVRGACSFDSGSRGASGSPHDATLYAPVSVGARRGDPSTELTSDQRSAWRHHFG